MTATTRTRTAAAAAVLALGLTGCSVSTAPDEVAVEYSAGPFSSTTFKNCVGTGTREYYGPGDQTFTYPAGQRTFAFNGGDNAEMNTQTVVSADDLELKVTGLVTFSLNVECEALQEMHERLGLKYKAYETAGWDSLIRDYIGQPLTRALDDATKNFAWRDLYTSAEAKGEWEAEVSTLLSQYMAEQGGGDYFGSPTYTGDEDEELGSPQLTLQQPTPPEEVRKALTKAQEAVEMTAAQEHENARVEAEAEAIETLVDLLGPDAYVIYEAIKSGQIEIMVVGDGTGTSVSAGD